VVNSRSTSLLPWIVAFKAMKATVLLALGITLLVAIRRDPVDLVMQIALAVHVPLTSRAFDRLLTLAFQATPTKEAVLAVTAFGYAILMAAEGVGLYLRRRWARWFTIGATSSLMPIEAYEIARRPGAFRVLVLLLNVAVVVYLWRRKEIFDVRLESGK
jgi:uncharacterized membrane protein (DUF2068 family)